MDLAGFKINLLIVAPQIMALSTASTRPAIIGYSLTNVSVPPTILPRFLIPQTQLLGVACKKHLNLPPREVLSENKPTTNLVLSDSELNCPNPQYLWPSWRSVRPLRDITNESKAHWLLYKISTDCKRVIFYKFLTYRRNFKVITIDFDFVSRRSLKLFINNMRFDCFLLQNTSAVHLHRVLGG